MKVKQLSKKLSLNKETVANLSVEQMRDSKGGVRWTEGCITGVICDTVITCPYSCIFSVQDNCTFGCTSEEPACP